ncbi:MAG: hypothetical protein GOV00_03610, partial [Candidatus Altiarchaeota archaeon]|nr:hypothetical protein [Candidatus Altiarchaeota archaeon]
KFSKQLKDNGVGKLLVVSGPPSSGKTDVLRGYLNKLSGSATHYAHPPLVNKLVTSGEAVLIDNYHKLNSGVENYARLLDEMATRGYFVVVSGDPLDSKNKPYASMREILPLADNVQVEHAYEKINGVRLPATKSRVVGGSLVPVSRHTFKSV